VRDDGLADDFLRGQRVEVCDCIVRRISCRAQAVMPDERLRFTADATLGGADRMLLDDKALLVLFPLYDASSDSDICLPLPPVHHHLLFYALYYKKLKSLF